MAWYLVKRREKFTSTLDCVGNGADFKTDIIFHRNVNDIGLN
jgi:hypothetical protein